MALYTTGEVAKLVGTTVRTVQYYDSKGILSPTSLSEGGRRLYSEEDVEMMKIICFLKELGLPLDSISKFLAEEEPEKVLNILLEQQEESLKEEIEKTKAKLEKARELKAGLTRLKSVSLKSIGDVAHVMENKRNLTHVHKVLFGVGIPMDLIEVGTFIYGIINGNWWPFAIGMIPVIALGVWVSMYFYNHTAYICPECHKIFKPSFKETFFARSTPHTRRLTCTECGHKGFCVETYKEE